MSIAIRMLWALATFIVYNAITLVLQVIGFVLVPVAIWLSIEEVSFITGRTIRNAPRWLWLWGNDEDGYDPLWWIIARKDWKPFRRMWVWAAFRNPVNNLRFIKALHPPPVVGKIKQEEWHPSWGTIQLVWQGLFCRLNIYTENWELRMGWKYEVWDIVTPCKDWRRFGVGFGTRFIKYN